ncbi:MAG: CBS domain-containing protein, partial [Nitrospinota bacterium]|nr:CBS domain-containing protein [Nitrospinota bacterium]
MADSMNRNFETLTPDAPADRALELILGRRQKAIPVLGQTDPTVEEGGHAPLEGIIARGDALRLLQQERNAESRGDEPYTRSVRTLARDRLSGPVYEVLEEAAHTAEAQGCRVYLVGGIVRDLMLDFDNLDVDLVVEGDGIAFARALGARMGGRYKAHPRFGVAVVTLPDGRKVDVATARVEYYEQPAALPVVEMSDIRTDLSRRDFSINAMAVQLNGEGAWRLLDFFGARRDLKDKVLRALHNLSFVEDPTRAFRAVRFSERYGFTIGAQTRTLLDHAVRGNLIDRLSGSRLFTELRLILDGPEPWRCVARLGELKLLRFIHPRLRETPALRRRFGDIDRALAWWKLLFSEEPAEAWRVYLMGLLGDLTDGEAEAACARLALPGRRCDPTLRGRREVENILAGLSGEEVSPSAV